jgi:hypothetical protein
MGQLIRAYLMVQPSLTRRDDEPRHYRALKRTAKVRPSLRRRRMRVFRTEMWVMASLAVSHNRNFNPIWMRGYPFNAGMSLDMSGAFFLPQIKRPLTKRKSQGI